MKRELRLSIGAVAASLLLPFLMAAPGQASITGASLGKSPSASVPFVLAGVCWLRKGPFATQSTAYQRRRYFMSRGASVSGVFPNNGGYAFKVFYPC